MRLLDNSRAARIPRIAAMTEAAIATCSDSCTGCQSKFAGIVGNKEQEAVRV
jgi:hypothetical protein